MKLFDLIDNERFNLFKENDINWDLLDNLNFTSKELEKTIDQFLWGLNNNHKIPGKEYAKLQGIGQWIHENNHSTPKQEKYAIIIMAYYWDELDRFKI